MKKLLVIGSLVADVIINIPHLPKTEEDLHIQHQSLSLGGCAGNVAIVLQELGIPFDLFAPIGQGVYGDFVAGQLAQRKMKSLLPRCGEENGCCYCMVEAGGERTFLSYHGAEYRFQKEWFSLLNPDDYDAVYVCGLELEEPSGEVLLDHLYTAKYSQIYFAPGPRIMKIPKSRMEKLLALSPILHLNQTEALAYSQKNTIEEAARALYAQSKAPLIITLGANGCIQHDGNSFLHIPANKVDIVDTIGAGDSHIAAIMAARSLSYPWQSALQIANETSASILQHKGVQFSDAQRFQLQLALSNISLK